LNKSYIPFEIQFQISSLNPEGGAFGNINFIFSESPIFYDRSENMSIFGPYRGVAFRRGGILLDYGFRLLGKRSNFGWNLCVSFGLGGGWKSNVSFDIDDPSTETRFDFSSYKYDHLYGTIGAATTIDLGLILLNYRYRIENGFQTQSDRVENYLEFSSHSIGVAIPFYRKQEIYR